MTACSAKLAFASAMSFIPIHASSEETMMNGTQMKPAFCSHSSPPSLFGSGSPPIAPKTLAVMTRGMMNCITDTPRLPSPALSAIALPFCAFGKKKLMFDIDEAKLPPPKPQSSASTRKMM